MKKMLALVTVLLLLCSAVFAEDSVKTFFPSLAGEPIYPVEQVLGQVVSPSKTEFHQVLSEALAKNFSFEWCEQYLSESSRKNLTTLYSGTFSTILPSKGLLFSRPTTNADESVSISVKFTNLDTIITFVMSGKSIVGINPFKK